MESALRVARVVVCDDTESIRRLIRLNLELEGYDVEETANAQLLVESLRGADRPVPELILLDAHMAPRDGWWAIGEIRADHRFDHVPVVLVTAGIHGLDPGVVEEAGFDAILGKPFDPDELLDLVSRIRRAGRGSAQPS